MIDPHAVSGARCHPDAAVARKLTFDSRGVDPETAFVALAGETTHGNRFIEEALHRGAPFVLTDQWVDRGVQVDDARRFLRQWARAQRDTHLHPVVGVTGSAGKTTAKTYIGVALDAAYTPGNLNTLDAIACFLLEHAGSSRPLVIEMGIDRLGEMDELMDLVDPDVGVVTSIGEAHLEALGTVANVALEKGKILAARQLALVSDQASAHYPGVPSYGLSGATFHPSRVEQTTDRTQLWYGDCVIDLPSGNPVVATAAVAAVAIAEQFRQPLTEVAARLMEVKVPGSRSRVSSCPFQGGEITVIDDTYNANPLSVHAALIYLSKFPGRKIAVLGDMLELGKQAHELHQRVGEWAAEKADVVYSLGAFASLLSEHPHDHVEGLVGQLKAELQPGDVVLFKASRGVQLERVLAQF